MNLYKDKEVVDTYQRRAEKAEARVAELEAENKNLLWRLLQFDPPEGLGY